MKKNKAGGVRESFDQVNGHAGFDTRILGLDGHFHVNSTLS